MVSIWCLGKVLFIERVGKLVKMFTNGKRIRRKHSCEVFVLRGGGLSHPCDIIAAERLIPPPSWERNRGLSAWSQFQIFSVEKRVIFFPKRHNNYCLHRARVYKSVFIKTHWWISILDVIPYQVWGFWVSRRLLVSGDRKSTGSLPASPAFMSNPSNNFAILKSQSCCQLHWRNEVRK